MGRSRDSEEFKLSEYQKKVKCQIEGCLKGRGRSNVLVEVLKALGNSISNKIDETSIDANRYGSNVTFQASLSIQFDGTESLHVLSCWKQHSAKSLPSATIMVWMCLVHQVIRMMFSSRVPSQLSAPSPGDDLWLVSAIRLR